MRWIIRSILAIIVLLTWTCSVPSLALSPSASLGMNSVEGLSKGSLAAVQESGPTMQVTVGFDGYCRSAGWCPVYVILSNEGAGIEGELRVVGRSTESDVYARRVMLPAQSRKAYFLYLSSTGSSTRARLKVQLLAGEGGDKVLSSEEVAVEWLSEGDWLYGVVSSSPSALNFLSSVAPASGSTGLTAGRSAKVAHLNLEVLPPDPLGWEALDVLVLNDVDTAALGSEQRRAMETWVAHGGHLIVGGGAGAARTVAGLTNLLPVTVGSTRSVDDLRSLGECLDAPITAGPYAVAETTLQDGEAIIEQGDLILLARRTYGAGTVDFVAFDAGLNPFTSWDDNTRLWKLIVEARAAGAQWLTVRNGYSAQEAIKMIPGLELPSTLQILAFMLVYTLLIGPVNYLVLRKLDRRELAWLTIPALVVGFTVCAYVTGFQIRGGMAIVHRLAVVYVPALSKVEGPEGSRVGRVSQVVGLFSPRRTQYDVWVASMGVREIPGDFGGPAAQSLHIIEEAEGLTIADLRVDVGGIQPFVAEGYADVPGIETNLRLVEDTTGGLRLEGTVRNGNVPLKEAVLIMGGDEQRLGDLEAGEEASITLSLHTYTPSAIPERIMGPGNYWGDRVLYRRYQFLQALFPYEGPGLGPDAHLLGWVEEEVPLPVEVVERPFSTTATALYVYDLPTAELETGTTVTIPSSLIKRQVEETTGGVNVWAEGFHIEPKSAVVFRFTIEPEMTVRQVDELVLDLQGGGYGSTSRPPMVSLWSWERGDWERLDVGWGQRSIPNAGAYVSPSGEVLLRLETGAEWMVDMNSPAITIRGQR